MTEAGIGMLGFEDGGTSHRPRNTAAPLEAEGQENILSPHRLLKEPALPPP